MSGAIFGDEVGSIVIDAGTYSTRVGYAGQDRPEFDIPSVVGFMDTIETIDGANVKSKKPVCGTTKLSFASDKLELDYPIKNGLIENWNSFECFLRHILVNQLGIDSSEHPLIMTEPTWNETKNRTTLSELVFEKFGVTAFYLGKSPVLSSFAHAKSTSLVIDSGYGFTSVSPVVDGYVLKKNCVHFPIASAYLLQKCEELFKKLNIDVIPSYMVSKKETTSDGAPPIFTLKNIPSVHDSWHKYMVKNVVHDFCASVLQISDSSILDRASFRQSPAYYEFPNGYYRSFNEERFIIPEALFNPVDVNNVSGSSILGVHNVAVNCALSCDVDIRAQLLNNICVVGGTTLLSGYMDRIQHEFANTIPPNMKHKILSNSYSNEKRFASWIGASILSSMTSFHQLWVSRSEYMESGRRALDLKCN